MKICTIGLTNYVLNEFIIVAQQMCLEQFQGDRVWLDLLAHRGLGMFPVYAREGMRVTLLQRALCWGIRDTELKVARVEGLLGVY